MGTATVRLMQRDGVTGPVGTIECGETAEDLNKAAVSWADGQTGHPWDVLVVEPKEGVCFAAYELPYGTYEELE